MLLRFHLTPMCRANSFFSQPLFIINQQMFVLLSTAVVSQRFQSSDDADQVIQALDGTDFLGQRITVEVRSAGHHILITTTHLKSPTV